MQQSIAQQMLKWILWVLLAMVLLIFFFIGERLTSVQLSQSQMNGELIALGIEGSVEIIRDENGVPHIYGKTQEDVFFGLGVAHAQDRFWQMEFTRLLAKGRLSEVLGSPTVPIDKFFRTLSFEKIIESSYDEIDAKTRAILESYAEGVNNIAMTKVNLPPEFGILMHKPEPWRAKDSLLFLKMLSMNLSTNMFHEIRRAQLVKDIGPELTEQFFPGSPTNGPMLPPDLARIYEQLPFDVVEAALPSDWQKGASNNWVLNGDHTVSGSPLLANDPHLELSNPSIWYLAHLALPEGNVVGGTVAGLPAVILGRNDNIAWGFTNTGADVQDLFIEQINPDNPREYRTPEGFARFEQRLEKIKVRYGRDHELIVRHTRHGPVLPDSWWQSDEVLEPGHVLSLAWTALDPLDTTPEASLKMMLARNWLDFRDAARLIQNPMQNIVYADRNGHIGMVAPGKIPIRKPENELQGLLPAPGWLEKYDWDGFIPVKELPVNVDPKSGKIVTANNKIVDEDYPYEITRQWEVGYRADHINKLLDAKDKHDAESFAVMQADVTSPFAVEFLPLLLTPSPSNERSAAAHALLQKWDGQMLANRPEPLIFTAWVRALGRLVYADELGNQFQRHWTFKPIFLKSAIGENGSAAGWCDVKWTQETEDCATQISKALDEALDELSDAYGRDMNSWTWGAAHEAVHAHNPFEQFFPILKNYFSLRVPSPGGFYTINRGGHNFASDAPYANIHGSGYRAIYDLKNLERSLFIQSTGQSSRPASPFYNNFLDKWLKTKYIPIVTDRSQIDTTKTGHLKLIPY